MEQNAWPGVSWRVAGYLLTRIPTDVMPWGDWKQLHPVTTALSKETGYIKPYGADPYKGYFESASIWFPVEHRDDRLFEKEVIYGIEYKGQ